MTDNESNQRIILYGQIVLYIFIAISCAFIFLLSNSSSILPSFNSSTCALCDDWTLRQKQFFESFSQRDDQMSQSWELEDVIMDPKRLSLSVVDFVAKFRHRTSNTTYVHVNSQTDTNNLFSISFRTPPYGDTGLTHILEHMVLSGSRKYPVKDPFFRMLKRSLGTFMNAWTAADHTSYLFTTQNLRDYYNLLDVYMDAVFHPLLQEAHFLQEGFRMEWTGIGNNWKPKNENDTETTSGIDSSDTGGDDERDLTFQGVVYNEMKGVVGDPNNRMLLQLNRALFLAPNVLNSADQNRMYAFNAGGDPRHIPELSYDVLRDYHRQFYHTSNALILTYGTFDWVEHLRVMDEKLRQVLDSQATTAVDKMSTVFSKVNYEYQSHEERIEILGPEDSLAPNPQKQTKFAVGFLANNAVDTFESFVLSVLCDLLLDNKRGMLHRELIESQLASSFFPYSGYEKGDLLRNVTAIILGLSGVDYDQKDNVEKVMWETLHWIAETGFNRSDIDSIINRMEIHMKHVSPSFGQALVMSMVPRWVHGIDPCEALQISQHIAQLKQLLHTNPNFMEHKLRQYIINNDRRVSMVMRPYEQYTRHVEQEERKFRESRKREICTTETARKELQQQTQLLLEFQQTRNMQNRSDILPCLQLHEISTDIGYRAASDIRCQKGEDFEVFYNYAPSNGLVYMTLFYEIPLEHIPLEMLQYLPLFTYVLPRLGAGNMSRDVQSSQIDLYTDGIDVSLRVLPTITYTSESITSSSGKATLGISISSTSLSVNVARMISLAEDIATLPHLNNTAQIRILLEELASTMSNSLTISGHAFAERLASKHLTEQDWLNEKLGGISFIQFLKQRVFTQMQKDEHTQQNQQQQHEQHEGTSIEHISKAFKHFLSLSFRTGVKALITCEKIDMGRVYEPITGALKRIVSHHHHASSTVKQQTLPTINARSFMSQGNTRVAVPLSFPVNFVATATFTVHFADNKQDHAALRVATQLLFPKLHREIREIGGAYGTRSAISMSGVFFMSTYRDPNIVRSLQVFNESIAWLCDNSAETITDQQLLEAKLGVFQREDAPVAFHQRPDPFFYNNLYDLERQEYRQYLLSVSAADIERVCSKYLTQPHALTGQAVIGSSEAIAQTQFNDSHTEDQQSSQTWVKLTTLGS